MSNSTPFYAIANSLVGFPRESMRVKVTRIEGDYAWVRTADLMDAGTPLTLDLSQIEPERNEVVVRHSAGFVAFA